jgi:hypothetical protein
MINNEVGDIAVAIYFVNTKKLIDYLIRKIAVLFPPTKDCESLGFN